MQLTYNGVTLPGWLVNKLLVVAKELNVPPSYLIVKLHYEGLWGQSQVARDNNNWSGMTWTGEPNRPSGVVVSKGSARPANEGGHYMRYESVEDFLKDWTYLIRRGGIYNVADSETFDEAVKGMFQYGGAKYDYATMNTTGSKKRYELYLKGMKARRTAINNANNGALDTLDRQFSKGVDNVVTAQQVIDQATKLRGTRKYSAGHKALVDEYNSIRPLPVGYKVTYNDDWCDVFVTVVAKRAGALDLIGAECGVQRHKAIFQQKGIWKGRVRPQAGDIIIWDWDGAGWADHIGYVQSVNGDRVTTIEGNTGGGVGSNTYTWNDWRIVGYARPNYGGSSAIETTNQKVTIADHATKWQTGESIAPSVIGKTYSVAGVKEVTQSNSRKAYLLTDGQYYIGWLLEQDAVGFEPYKSNTEIAQEVIDGEWGNNPERIKKLTDAGYDPAKVQNLVNELLTEQGEEPVEDVEVSDNQQIGGDDVVLAKNEVELDGVVYVINKK